MFRESLPTSVTLQQPLLLSDEGPTAGIDTAPSPKGKTLTVEHSWAAHSWLHLANDAGRHGASDGRKQGCTINHWGMTIGISLVSQHYITNPPIDDNLVFYHYFSFFPLRLCRRSNHIYSLVSLLHADAMQQLEVALLGTPATKVLDIIAMATYSPQACPSIPSDATTSITLAVKSSATLVPL